MNELDDRQLLRPEAGPELPPPKPRSDSRIILAIGAIALVLGGIGGWWWSHRERPQPDATPAVNATEEALPEAAPRRELPPLEQMDTFVRALASALSSHPTLARWLATDDLVEQMAVAIDRISRGQSPARQLSVLRPDDVMVVRGTRGQMTIDPESYRRYDSIAAAVMSLNAKGVAEAYRTIEPRLDEAYRALGTSENTVDEALAVAIDVILATPDVQDPIRVVPGRGATYAFADPTLEALRPVQKQLILMGPANAAAIKERLREIAEAIKATPRQTG